MHTNQTRQRLTQTCWTFEVQQKSQVSNGDQERLSSNLAEARLCRNSELEDNCSVAWK